MLKTLNVALLLALLGGIALAASGTDSAEDISVDRMSEMLGGTWGFYCDNAAWAASTPGDPLTCEGKQVPALQGCGVGPGKLPPGSDCTMCGQQRGACGQCNCESFAFDDCSQGFTSGTACDCGFHVSGVCTGLICVPNGPANQTKCTWLPNTCCTNFNAIT